MRSWRESLSLFWQRRRILAQERRRAGDIARDARAAEELDRVKANPSSLHQPGLRSDGCGVASQGGRGTRRLRTGPALCRQ
jgi:hypothetical protein